MVRQAQVDEVVDGHRRFPLHSQRKRIVRLVEYLDAVRMCATTKEKELGNRVFPVRYRSHSPSIRRRYPRRIIRRNIQRESVRGPQLRQRVDEALDVSPDTEVEILASVNCDVSHEGNGRLLLVWRHPDVRVASNPIALTKCRLFCILTQRMTAYDLHLADAAPLSTILLHLDARGHLSSRLTLLAN